MDDSNVPQRMKKKKSGGIYMKNIISRKVILPFNLLGNNIEYNIKLSLSEDLEGKCSSEDI